MIQQALCWADVSDLTPRQIGYCEAITTMIDEHGQQRVLAAYPMQVDTDLDEW